MIALHEEAPAPSAASRRAYKFPFAGSKKSPLFAVAHMTQTDVSRRLNLTTSRIQQLETKAFHKIRAALLADPEVVVEHDPEFASRHGITTKAGVIPLNQRTVGGRLLPERYARELESMRVKARTMARLSEHPEVCPEDRAEAAAAAREILSEIALLEAKMAAL